MSVGPKKKLSLQLKSRLPALALVFLCFLIPDPASTRSKDFEFSQLSVSSDRRALATVMSLPNTVWSSKHSAVSYPKSLASTMEFRETWYRVKIPAVSNYEQPKSLVADVNFGLIREIDFYLVSGERVVNSKLTGSDRAESTSNFGPHFYFPFMQDSSEAQSLYVRVGSEGVLISPLAIRTESGFHERIVLNNLLVGLLVGISLGIGIYTLFLYVSLRRKMYLYYVIFQIVVCIFASGLSGAFMLFVPSLAQHSNILISVMEECAVLAVALLVIFSSQFLSLDKNFPNLEKQTRVVAVLACILALSIPLISRPIGMVFILLFIIACIFRSLVVYSPYIHLKVVLRYNAGFFGVAVGCMVTILSWFDVIERSIITENLYYIGVNWLNAAVASAIANQIREVESDRRHMAKNITAMGPQAALNSSVSSPYADQYTTSQMQVSIMFIDIVGFSQIAERVPGKEMFEHLTRRMSSITQIIHEFGGSIDRSLGDGVLCFFGYNGNSNPAKSASNAFLAAKKIQELSAREAALIAEKQGESMLSGVSREPPLLPVRIGIHTADVLIGNVGGDMRVDFTMIGTGVNYASRLEDACSPFKIIISTISKQYLERNLVGADMSAGFSEIFISIKHHADLVRAYEYNPFHSRSADLVLAEKLYLSQLGISARDERLHVAQVKPLYLESSHGRMQVLDFSLHGFRVRSDVLFGEKSMFAVAFVIGDEHVAELLDAMLINEITVEVRWGRKSLNKFEHGVRIVGGSQRQRRELFKVLSEHYADHGKGNLPVDMRVVG